MKVLKSRCYGSIRGIPLVFEDVISSNTINIVTTELETDYYGLERIKIQPTDTIIDIGGNIGMFSIYAKKKFGCKVIAFEPVLMNYEQFKENIVLNGLSLNDIELHNVAITDKEGEKINIYTPLDNTGASSEYTQNGIKSVCFTETLDKYITEDCKYLKIDCEGAEYKIIPSILNKINQFKHIGIEYHRLNNDQDPKVLHKLLRNNFKGSIFFRNYE